MDHGARRRKNVKGAHSHRMFMGRRSKPVIQDDERQRLSSEQAASHMLSKNTLHKFTDFPLSSKTLKGLEKAGYIEPTDIQKESIPLALSNHDVLGAAKTGSGKTLAFLIPVLETLWKEKFSSYDGLGALIVSPTRELAYQTFEVLRKIGCYHDMSAGLVIGGKDLQLEQQRITNTNIIICTPGRLLQHMDETPNFSCDNLKVLVLDEADRILDLGFAETMNSIVENIPSVRQTLLFSATQTKSVKDLARLSLKDPTYISAHEDSEYVTPQKLIQSYVVCELYEKLNFLFSFLRNHTKSKILIFLSSCKQVKFMYEAFKRIRPGVPLMALYGKQKQLKRVAIYNEFCRRSSAALFATDIAARGLDFPGINWVIQLDCPEDVNTYIHRAGRTARYEKDGQALLVLMPSEKEILKDFKDRKIPIEEIRINPKKLQDIQKKLSALCAASQELKHWAQRSIVSYVRSVFLHSNKKIFDVHKLDVPKFASSLGLLAPPRIRFMKKMEKLITDNRGKDQDALVKKIMKDMGINESEESEDEDESFEAKSPRPTNTVVSKESKRISVAEREDDLLVVKDRNLTHEAFQQELSEKEAADSDRRKTKMKIVSKTALAKKIIRKGIQLNSKIVFDDSGEVVERSGVTLEKEEPTTAVEPVTLADMETAEVGGINIEEHRELMRVEDKLDRKRERERVKFKHRKERLKMKQERRAQARNELGASLITTEPEEREIGTNPDVLDKVSDAESIESEDEESEPLAPPVKERKVKEGERPRKQLNDQELFDDEEIALRLLTGVS